MVQLKRHEAKLLLFFLHPSLPLSLSLSLFLAVVSIARSRLTKLTKDLVYYESLPLPEERRRFRNLGIS